MNPFLGQAASLVLSSLLTTFLSGLTDELQDLADQLAEDDVQDEPAIKALTELADELMAFEHWSPLLEAASDVLIRWMAIRIHRIVIAVWTESKNDIKRRARLGGDAVLNATVVQPAAIKERRAAMSRRLAIQRQSRALNRTSLGQVPQDFSFEPASVELDEDGLLHPVGVLADGTGTSDDLEDGGWLDANPLLAHPGNRRGPLATVGRIGRIQPGRAFPYRFMANVAAVNPGVNLTVPVPAASPPLTEGPPPAA